MDQRKHILYVGYNGFPFGFAQIERQRLISKGLMASGVDVTIVSRYGTHGDDRTGKVAASGTDDGIPYLYASGTPFRQGSFLKRNLRKFRGLFNEISIIRKGKKSKNLDAILITTNTFYNIAFYGTIAYLFGIKSVLDNAEYWSSHDRRKKLSKRIDNSLYDHHGFKFVSHVICISDFLIDVVRKRSITKPIVKIPAIVDFSKFASAEGQEREADFLLYCASAFYYDVLDFVVTAFEKAETADYFLYVVANGEPDDMERVRQRILASVKTDHIRLFSKLEYKKLVHFYMTSRALLIPLRNTMQDVARFPHKTGEYCAAKRAIISTNIGEIKNYFFDHKNALLAEEYEISQYAEKLSIVVKDEKLADELGQRSYLTGMENFSHIELGKKLYNFLYPDHSR